MKKLTDQQIARHLLVHREKGYSIAYILRRTKWRYALHLGVILLFLAGFFASKDCWGKGFCLWMMGMFFGALCRDAGWLLRIKRTWPFSERITNWPLVEEIAAANESAPENSKSI